MRELIVVSGRVRVSSVVYIMGKVCIVSYSVLWLVGWEKVKWSCLLIVVLWGSLCDSGGRLFLCCCLICC